MGNRVKLFAALLGSGVAAIAPGCASERDDDVEANWSALMDDGDVGALAPAAMARPAPAPAPPRFCPNDDCAGSPLAFWKMDDCNPFTTELQDTALSGVTSHPAFRAVSVACAEGADGQGVRLAAADDIVYAPDQPDFTFNQGLTVAAWINPDRVTGTQSIVRKRFDGSSSFLLAIDDRRLAFVLRLTNGRVVGVTAPIRAGRFTHVAATYDGQQAILYVDGVAAARVRAAGTLRAGAGPILLGNDANGRQLRGTIDEVWLNTLAAPADVIAGLTCIRRTQLVSLSPSETPPQIAGATVSFDLSVTNQSSASCPVDQFDFFPFLPFPLAGADPASGVVSAGPGQTAHATINVRSLRSAPVGSYRFQVYVAPESQFRFFNVADATYVVGTGPVACDGAAPQTPLILGSPASPAGGPAYTFAAPGLAAPVVTPVIGPNGSTQALEVAVDPGVPTDAASSFLGFGLGFGQPPCVDASAYVGVRFTITGDLGTCAPTFSVLVSQDNSVAFGPFGTCTADVCLHPSSGPLTTGTNVIRFADMTGGTPLPTVDATALNGVQWTLTAPSDGATAPCVANFTISDVSFITDPSASKVGYTFDTDTQGWTLNDYLPTLPSVNLAVTTPPGGAPPALTFEGTDGDPAPGALQLRVRFTAFDQWVDPIIPLPFPGLDLSGRALHARVRLVSGSFDAGGVQLHASSGPSFVYTGAFMDAASFPLGVWVPMTLDLVGGTTPDFDPSQVVQLGVSIASGWSAGGGIFPDTGADTVLEIDTVTD